MNVIKIRGKKKKDKAHFKLESAFESTGKSRPLGDVHTTLATSTFDRMHILIRILCIGFNACLELNFKKVIFACNFDQST